MHCLTRSVHHLNAHVLLDLLELHVQVIPILLVASLKHVMGALGLSGRVLDLR